MLIHNGWVVTLGEPNQVLFKHSIEVENGLIKRIGPADSFDVSEHEKVLPAYGRVIMPGFINAHTHFYSAFACGYNKGKPAHNFKEVLENLWWRLDRQFGPDDVVFSGLIAGMDAIRQGCTTLFDHLSSPNYVDGAISQVSEAMREAGLRANVCYEVSDREGLDNALEGIRENKKNLEREQDNPLVTNLFGLHASFTLSDETLKQVSEIVKAGNYGVHIHVAEDKMDQEHCLKHHGKRVVHRLHDFGLLGPKTICAHGVWLDESELELLAKTDTILTHQAQSNQNNGVGQMDLLAAMKAGVLVGLGTDAMTYNMIHECRSALFAQRNLTGDPSAGFAEVTQALLRNNQRIAARFWDNPPGELAVGRPADVIVMDYDSPTPMNADNFLGHLIFGMHQSTVLHTVVAGKVLMENRNLFHLYERDYRYDARTLSNRVWNYM